NLSPWIVSFCADETELIDKSVIASRRVRTGKIKISKIMTSASAFRPIAITVLFMLHAAVGASQSITTCDAASPFDRETDEVALQACLDNFDWVLLTPDGRPDYVGY